MAKQKGTPKPVILDAVQIAPGKYQAIVPPAEEPTMHTYTWDFTAESVAGTPSREWADARRAANNIWIDEAQRLIVDDELSSGWCAIQEIIQSGAWRHWVPIDDKKA